MSFRVFEGFFELLFVLGVFGVELRGCVEVRGFRCGNEGVELRGCVELRGLWCGTEGFWELKRCGPCVELMC